MSKEVEKPPISPSKGETSPTARSDILCKPCAVCGSDIFKMATVCPLCQKSQKRWIRFLNSSSGPASLIVATIALSVTLAGNYVTSIDKYLGYYFFENPPLFGAASWQPDISDIPYDAHGRYEIDITALSVEVSIYNDGFSPTLIIGYKCISNQQYSASDIMFYDGSTSAQVIGPFTAKSTLTFEQDKDILLANGSSETISFRPSNLYVEIEGVPDFSPLEGKDFLLSGGTFASCHVLHWYQDRLWGLPQVLHYSSDTLNPPGVALFSAIISNGVTEEIKRRVGAP